MAILLLCTGDESAKDLLRQAITAHYSINPTAFESVHMQATARVAYPLGAIKIPMSLQYDIRFQFPYRYREDYQIRFLKIPVVRTSESYDGRTYREKNLFKPQIQTSGARYIASVNQHMWTYSAMLLIPLSETYVDLQQNSDNCIVATNTHTGVSATICLYDNYQLKQITVTSEHTNEIFRLELSSDTQLTNGVKTCTQIGVWHNNQFLCDLISTRFEFIEGLDDDIFQLT